MFGDYNAKAGRENMQFAQKVVSCTVFLGWQQSYECEILSDKKFEDSNFYVQSCEDIRQHHRTSSSHWCCSVM
jgi:hypothetical protein